MKRKKPEIDHRPRRLKDKLTEKQQKEADLDLRLLALENSIRDLKHERIGHIRDMEKELERLRELDRQLNAYIARAER